MGVRFAAKDGTRKSSDYTGRNVARFGHAPDTTQEVCELGNLPIQPSQPSAHRPAVKRGRPRGERPREEILLFTSMLCAAVRHTKSIPQPTIYVN